MEPTSTNEPGAGAGAPAPAGTPSGAPAPTPAPSNPSGTPAPGAGTPDPRDAQIADLRGQLSKANDALLARPRGSQPSGQPGQDDPFSTPQGQLAIALEVAENRLRGRLEQVYSLYPELTTEDIGRIRANPWAFASRDTMLNGDWERAALEVESELLKRADAIAAAKGGNPAPGQPGNGNPAPTPAQVNGNPAPAPGNEPGGEGLPSKEDLWTMPMDQLETLRNKELSKLQPKS